MRKVIWCCSAAGVLSAGSFLSLAYYACRCPDSLVGRAMQVIGEASLAMQPLSGLFSLAIQSSQANAPTSETAGSVEECIPDDPQPVAPDRQAEVVIEEEVVIEKVTNPNEVAGEAAPIVIGEEEPMPREEAAPVVPMPSDKNVVKGCPVIMPYCQDDGDKPMTPPVMPGAEAGDDEPARANSEETNFKEWMKLFDADKKEKSLEVEELPAPIEDKESQAEPKCQEDIHLHEHYSGCPRVTCPYEGKSSPSCTPARKSGKEEASEEPPQERKKSSRRKVGKSKEEELPDPNIDTMEYRKSDAGLNEYGPGPLQ